MNTKHTQGPWTFPATGATNDGGVSIMRGDWKNNDHDFPRIAVVDIQTKCKRGTAWNTPCEERDANARLIAAAPEMLTALENLAHVVSCYGTGKGDNHRQHVSDTTGKPLTPVMQAALDAIAKAKGGQQ